MEGTENLHSYKEYDMQNKTLLMYGLMGSYKNKISSKLTKYI